MAFLPHLALPPLQLMISDSLWAFYLTSAIRILIFLTLSSLSRKYLSESILKGKLQNTSFQNDISPKHIVSVCKPLFLHSQAQMGMKREIGGSTQHRHQTGH